MGQTLSPNPNHVKTIPFASLLVTALTFSGCGQFRSSQAWSVATDTRIADRGEAGGEAYAEGLQQKMAARGVEARVVKFHYRVSPQTDGITQTGVIYRNETTPRFPWFFVDNRTSKPVWLPNGSVEEQLRFVVRNPTIEVLETRDASAPVATRLAPEKRVDQWASIFRQMHGTAYDSSSPVDRAKMASLKKRSVASLRM